MTDEPVQISDATRQYPASGVESPGGKIPPPVPHSIAIDTGGSIMIRQPLLGILTTALFVSVPLAATELSLEAAMATARAHSREVLAAQAQVQAGAARVRQAKGYRLPLISLQEIWVTTENPAEVFALQLNQEQFSFEEFVRGDPNRPDWFDNATTRFLMTVPIYTGGEIGGRIAQAQASAEAAEMRAAWIENSAALAAAEAYIRLAQARENAALLAQVLETIEAHVALARAYVDQGMVVRSELLRAQVEESRIEDLLVTARGQARVAEAQLAFRLAADIASGWDLQSLAEPTPIAETLDDWLASADARADLLAARRLLAAAELEIQVQRSALLPKLGLAARYDLFDDALFGSSGRSGAVMATASIDLFAGHRHRAAKAAADANFEAARHQITQFAAAVRLEVRDAFEKALSARERYRTATAAQQAAAEAERITEERFRQGVAKMIDLLDATTARQEAQTRELVARTETHLAALALAVKSGRRPETMLTNHISDPARSES